MQFIATLILVITWPANGFGLSDKFMSYIREIKTNLSTTTKEKDDENCEYEMIWDAEGSMHLVKKAAAKVPVQRSDSRFTGRSVYKNLSCKVSQPVACFHTFSPLEYFIRLAD